MTVLSPLRDPRPDQAPTEPGTFSAAGRAILRWWGFALALAVPALLAAGPLYDGDGWWHLRNGEVLLSSGVPAGDLYSWTAPGAPWMLDEWAYDVIIALAHRAGGDLALSLYKVAAVVAIGVGMAALARRAGARRSSSAVAATLGVAALFLYVTERPQSLSFALLPLVLIVAERALQGSRRALVGLFVLVAAWSNLHLAALAGAAAVGALALGDAIDRRRISWPAMVAAAASVATVLTPYGVAVYGHVLSARQASVGVRDWDRLDPTRWPDLPVAVFAALVVGATVVTGRWRSMGTALPLATLAVMAAVAMRNGPYLVIVGVAELALALDRIPRPALARPARLVVVAVLGWAVVAVPLLRFALAGAGTRRDEFPLAAVSALPSGCRLFNEYELGGWVIWQRPDVPVSMDGRNLVYGAARVAEQQAVLRGEPSLAASLQWLDDRAVTCALVRPSRALTAALAADDRWRQIGAEPGGVAFVRSQP